MDEMERFGGFVHLPQRDMLQKVYGACVDAAQARCVNTAEGFLKAFGREPAAFFSVPGRTELGGNHTDHQHGCVLAASVDLDLIAAATATHDDRIRILSEGYPECEIDLSDLSPKEAERGTSAALIRGVAAGFRQRGFSFDGCGFDAYLTSNLPGGSGLSSSAAFEVLMGLILDHLCFGEKTSAEELAKIGQFAENTYFGKPCGLMDQMACAMGGAVFIDFEDPAALKYEQIPLNLAEYGFALCIIDCGADHADLTHEYAAITEELKRISGSFGKACLREVSETDFYAHLPSLRKTAGDRAVLRAMHVFKENRRAQAESISLKERDLPRFLSLVRESGYSSALYLQNITPCGQTARQEMLFTIALCEHMLNGQGAVRVHGGGFGGTVQAFVPLDSVREFRHKAEAVLGTGCCRILEIRSAGAIRLS